MKETPDRMKNTESCIISGIDISGMTLYDFLRNSVAEYPEHYAVKLGDYKLTYKELDAMTAVMAGNLRLAGFEKEDKITIFLPNSPEFIASFWALARSGFVGAVANPLYSETELLRQLDSSDSKAIITTASQVKKIYAVLNSYDLKRVYVVGNKGEVPPEYVDIIRDYEDLLEPNKGYTCKNLNSDDLALLQFTGGTTGIPKGCMLTHKNLISDAVAVYSVLSHIMEKGKEVFLGGLPYFHIYGLQTEIIIPVYIGATMVPMAFFSPKSLLTALESEKVTCMPSAPAVFAACSGQKSLAEHDLSRLKLIISGSAPLFKEQREEFEKHAPVLIAEGYGLSEASPVTHLAVPTRPIKIGSIGHPIPGIEVKITDPEYGIQEYGSNKAGELCVKGPQVIKGYYKEPSQTEMVLRDGWLYTGDIAYRDDDGYYFITARKKDLIISGGYNIYPREVEEVLFKHPDVAEAAVVGIPHKTRGELVKAFIVLKPESKAEKSDIVNFCRNVLANYKIPREIEFRDSLPKNAVGKVLRKDLREE
ncbi:MAG: long-chain fatty acid--CoA ligase [Candidatus Riflebacteria bacterium]|nr:long-chain fatty acid--CoA ligase [Candidatus Riflebacteria bacterium]